VGEPRPAPRPLATFAKAVERQATRLPAGRRKEPARHFAPVSAIKAPRRGTAGERLRR
jgi:hypothetical protein